MRLLCLFPQGRKIIFGICQVWVRPTRFKDDVRKCVFLGYVPHTDRLIIYYNCESECVKITSYCKFDEGFNDLPTESVPLGFQKLICENQDEKLPLINWKFHLQILIFLSTLLLKNKALMCLFSKQKRIINLCLSYIIMNFMVVYILTKLLKNQVLNRPSTNLLKIKSRVL